MEPVRLTKLIFLSFAIHSACSLSPLIILNILLADSFCSKRSKAFFQILKTANDVSGVLGDGFQTLTFPQIVAIAKFQLHTAAGKLKDVIFLMIINI